MGTIVTAAVAGGHSPAGDLRADTRPVCRSSGWAQGGTAWVPRLIAGDDGDMVDNSRIPGAGPQPGSGANSGSGSRSGSGLERVYDALHRSPVRRLRDGRVIGGVASGLARHFGLDPMLVRVGFVVLTMLLGIGLSLYLLAWFLLPDEHGTLALQRAVRDHDTGSIVLGVFAGLSLLNAPGGDDGGVWWTVLSLLTVGAVVFFFVRRHRSGPPPEGAPNGGREPGVGLDAGSEAGSSAGPAAGSSRGPGMSATTGPDFAGHGSPTRGGATSVFDPVTGRWVPAVPGGVSQPRPPAPQAPPVYSPAGGHADHDWSRPADGAPPVAPVVATPALPRPGLGVVATTLVLLGTAILGVGAGALVSAAAVPASAVVVGAAVALAFLSVVVVTLSVRGRRAGALALGVLLLLPVAAGVASFERTGPDGTGFTIEVGPR